VDRCLLPGIAVVFVLRAGRKRRLAPQGLLQRDRPLLSSEAAIVQNEPRVRRPLTSRSEYMPTTTRPGDNRRREGVALQVSLVLTLGALLYLGSVLNAAASTRRANLIAFESNRSGMYQVYVMNSDGTNQRQLTQFASQRENFDPALSPDGRRIVFESDRKNQNASDIWVMNADGSGSKQLTTSPDADRNPAWSPDGKWIAFESNRTGSYQIYVMSVAAPARQIQITSRGQNDDPAWSPDSKRIAFDSTRDGNREIYVMNRDGSRPVRLTTNPKDDVNPAFSPDGKLLAFQSNRNGNDEVYVMSAARPSSARDLTRNPAHDADPTWSPDSKKIAFDTNRDGNLEVYVMTATGSSQTVLSNSPADDLVPSW
jgi:Tol biopolymer transport system component